MTTIAILTVVAILYMALIPPKWRGWTLLLISVIAIYALQSRLNIPRLDFILPTFTLVLTVSAWLFTKPDNAIQRDDRITFVVVGVIVLAIAATRYLAPEFRLTSQPPDPLHVALVLVPLVGMLTYAEWRGAYRRISPISLMLVVIIILFMLIKADPLTVQTAAALRGLSGRDVSLASVDDLAGWLGFSYVAFRLIHTLRDAQSGKLPALTLREYLTYVIFFPAYTAGPIDRAERFVQDYRALDEGAEYYYPGESKLRTFIRHRILAFNPQRFVEGFGRVSVGVFKKFVIADSLALFALNSITAEQAQSAPALWLMLYAFAFQLFFDFSGYSDIAIGIGIMLGIKLPENFDRPYFKNNITAFWQSWHMTLSSWARFYVFTPLSRALLSRKPKPPTWAIILIAHVATMLVIGLWHDFTLAFVVWGLWHALGLYIHKQWSDRTRFWFIGLKENPQRLRLWYWVGVFITFHFVVLSWVWFALPEFEQALRVFLRLFGL